MIIDRHQNNFDFIRFLAASYVIVNHSYALVGDKWIVSEFFAGNVAVAIFFLISGYLISGSAISSRSIKNYSWKRFLRIYPGLFVVVFLTVFVLGPLLSTLKPLDYFLEKETYLYLITVSVFKTYHNLPGVFESNIGGAGVNGSLWTLVYELIVYIVAGVAVTVGYFKGKKNLLLIAGIIMLFIRILLGHRYGWYNYSTPYLLNLNIMFLFEWLFYFVIGAVVYNYKEKVVFKGWVLIVLTILYSLLAFFKMNAFSTVLHYVVLAYAIFYFANIKGVLNSFGRFGDFSYGLYIYAFPIQQTLISIYPNIDAITLTCCSFLLTLLFAILSWHLIEKQFLKYKNFIG